MNHPDFHSLHLIPVVCGPNRKVYAPFALYGMEQTLEQRFFSSSPPFSANSNFAYPISWKCIMCMHAVCCGCTCESFFFYRQTSVVRADGRSAGRESALRSTTDWQNRYKSDDDFRHGTCCAERLSVALVLHLSGLIEVLCSGSESALGSVSGI